MWLVKLNEMKKSKGLTLEEISNLSNIPKGTLNKLFSGQTKDPQLSTIKAVVYCLGCTLDDLSDEHIDSLNIKSNRQQKTINRYLTINAKEKVDDYVDMVFESEGHKEETS